MSTPWYTIFGPRSWPGVEINTGNKKIDAVYYNLLSDKNVQLAASGVMWLVAGTGIRMITPGYVDVSGLRAHTMLFKDAKKINSSGQIIPTYSGSVGSVVYKYDDHNLASIPDLVYNSGIGKLTLPSKEVGLLYVGRGNVDDGQPPTKEFASFADVIPVPARVIPSVGEAPPTIIPSYITHRTHAIFESGISIYPNLDSYKGSILTHMGSGNKVEWSAAPYLKADGAVWNRYPKRPILIDGDRIIFYINKPKWAQDWQDSPSLETIRKEYGIGEDTIELNTLKTRQTTHIKFATTILYGVGDVQTENGPDLLSPLNSLFSTVTFRDPDETDPDAPLAQGFAVKICSPAPWPGNTAIYNTNGYAFSATKGAYLSMQLSPDATKRFSCAPGDPSTSPFRFKPSTSNNISIRPNVNTGFNLLAENIDFMIFGQTKTQYNNYQENLFDLDNSLTPTGLIPAFRVDANIPNAASGTIESGVYYVKYLDRARINPSGWSYDYNPKVMINTRNAYQIASLATGLNTGVGLYADLTVSGITYSNQIIADKIFLNPKPTSDNAGVYIANSLLTIDRSGRVISRVPRQNPTAPSAPSGIRLDPGHTNGIGNTEVSLVWTAPENDGRSALIDYVLQFSSNNGETWTDLPNNLYSIDRASSTTPLATVVGLSPLVSYQFRVAAQNGIGLGDYSDGSDSITPGSAVPKRPDNLTSTRAFDETLYSNITLTWDTPQSGADTVLGYVIEESKDNGTTWQYYNLPSSLISSTSEVISATESVLDYVYRISAWNSYGQSAFAYVYVQGNVVDEVDPEEEARQLEKENDVLSNWDFGTVLFTGVCPI